MKEDVKNIGMLTVRNEVYMIDEFMDDVERYFDHIVVMDDSDDGTYDRIASRKCVDLLVKFTEIYDESEPRCDGQKAYIFRHILNKWGDGTWITNLNADALFGDNPNEAVEFGERHGLHMVPWRTFDFRMHASDKEEYERCPEEWRARPVADRLTWCKDSTWREWLQFKAYMHHYFDPKKHHCVVPTNFEHCNDNVLIEPVLLHYPLQSPMQVKARRDDRAKTGFRGPEFYEEVIAKGFFLEEEGGIPYVPFKSQNVNLFALGVGNERFKQGPHGLSHPELLAAAPW